MAKINGIMSPSKVNGITTFSKINGVTFGVTVWWEIDELPVPAAFDIDHNYSADDPGDPSLSCAIGSDTVVYQALVSGFPQSVAGFDPSGGNLIPVFWSSQSEPAAWSAGDYDAGEAVKLVDFINTYWYANSAATAADVPGVSGVWTQITTWNTGDDFIAGISWTDYSGSGDFYKCEILSGPGTDFGVQSPGSPTQFWQVYTQGVNGGQVHNMGTTYALDDIALKTDYSAWYHSLFNGNVGHAIP